MPHPLWFVLIVTAAVMIMGAPSGERRRTPSWFDLLPYLTQSKKQRTRLQQTPKKRRKR